MARHPVTLAVRGSRPLAALLWERITRHGWETACVIVVVLAALTRYYALTAVRHPWMWAVPPAAWYLAAAGLTLQNQEQEQEQESGGQPDGEEQPDEPDEDTPGTGDCGSTPPAPPSEEDHRAALLHWLIQLINGRNGVHLRELYTALRDRPALARLTDPQLRACLDRYEVPVTRSLTVDGTSGKSGVRRTDIEALLPSPAGETPQPPLSARSLPSDLRDSRPQRVPLSGGSRPERGDLDQHFADVLAAITGPPTQAPRKTA